MNPQKTLTRQEAEKTIRELVAQGAVVYTRHCKTRMAERGIVIPQILNCLAKGKVTEDPFLVYENGGGYETRVEKMTAGEWLRVAVCLRFDQSLLVITVIN
jgi:hypothetical protein